MGASATGGAATAVAERLPRRHPLNITGTQLPCPIQQQLPCRRRALTRGGSPLGVPRVNERVVHNKFAPCVDLSLIAPMIELHISLTAWDKVANSPCVEEQSKKSLNFTKSRWRPPTFLDRPREVVAVEGLLTNYFQCRYSQRGCFWT